MQHQSATDPHTRLHRSASILYANACQPCMKGPIYTIKYCTSYFSISISVKFIDMLVCIYTLLGDIIDFLSQCRRIRCGILST